jgi:seryl-tRNA(Sec) selenium transferase
MGYSFAERINDTKVMLAGLEANLEQWTRRGITKEFVDGMRQLYDEIRAIDNTHEALKARLKETTAELWSKMADLNKMFQEAKTLIKLDTPWESWQLYGFTGKPRATRATKSTPTPTPAKPSQEG